MGEPRSRINYVMTTLPFEQKQSHSLDIREHMLKEATQVYCYWKSLDDARKVATKLSTTDIENGTFVLRPSKEHILVVSVKKLQVPFPQQCISTQLSKNANLFPLARSSASADRDAILHFPVNSEVVEAHGSDTPLVFYSILQDSTFSQKISSLKDLIKFLDNKTLTGNNLGTTCKFKKGIQNPDFQDLPAEPKEFLRRPPLKRVPNVNEDEDQRRVLRKSKSEDNEIYKNLEGLSIQPDSTGTTVFQRSNSSATTAAEKRPIPAPRLLPKVVEDNHQPVPLRRTEKCFCGIPRKVTRLACKWSVHRSLKQETYGMLYFRNDYGRTCWAPPPIVDSLSSSYEYLKYGRLNIRCFKNYVKKGTYSDDSELLNFSKYEIWQPESVFH